MKPYNETFDNRTISILDIMTPVELDEDIKYSCWHNMDGEFLPAIDLKIEEKLPSGCYKVTWDNRQDDYRIKPFNANSDEAYRFSESYTVDILNEAKKFWEKEEVYKKYGLIHKRGLLLEGPAGTGKSVIISLLIEDLLKNDGIVFVVNNPSELSFTLSALPTVISKIEKGRKIIVVIEDIDKIINANGEIETMVLDFLDGKSSIDHQFVIMTSNDTDDLSEALLRPSRIDMRFCIEAPTEQVRREYLQKKGIPEDVLDEFVSKTDGLTFAQLKEVFTGTMVLDKNIDEVVDQLINPMNSRNYLNSRKKKISL